MSERRKSSYSESGNCVEVKWRKSSLSMSNGHCVQVRGLQDGGVVVRNSRDPEGPVLVYTPAEWAAFMDGVKAGEFDDLLTLSAS